MSAAFSLYSPAFTLLSTCSGLVAPAITLATTGCAEQPGERELEQRVAALLGEGVELLDLVEVLVGERARAARAPRGEARALAAAPRRGWYLPVSSPLASGKYGRKPRPSCCARRQHARARSSRSSRLYSFCARDEAA